MSLGFDFDAARGITLNGSDVSIWEDSSGNLNHTTQTSAGNQPSYTVSNSSFNGFPSVNFSKASTEWLGFNGSSLPFLTYASSQNVGMTIFVVMRKPVKVTADEVILSFGNLATVTTYYSFGLVYQNSNTQRQRIRIQGSTNAAETTQTGSEDHISHTPMVLCYQLTGTDMQYYAMGESENPFYDIGVKNNTTTDYSVQGNFVGLDRFTLGAFGRNTVTLPADMQIARVVGYKKSFTDSERYDVASFLWNKYIAATPEIDDFAGILHNWDASQLSEGYGQPVSTFTDSGIGAKNFRADLSTRPIVALGPNSLKVLEFDGINDFMTAGSASDWSVLHDTNPHSVFVVYRVVSASRTAVEPIIDTVNMDLSTASGMGLYHYNTTPSSHTFKYAVGAAISSAPALNFNTQAYVIPQEWHVAAFNYEHAMPSAEENFRLWMDGEPFMNLDFQATPSSSTPSFNLHLGRLANNTTTFAKIQVAQIVVFNRPVGWRYETHLIHKALARKWGVGISVVVGGNGMVSRQNDTESHRGFPAVVFDENDNMHVLYRRGETHGSSAGSAILKISGNGIDWPIQETVIASGEVRSGVSDWRIGSGYERITTGPYTGRLCWATEVSSANSDLVPGSVYVSYSDDNGGSWTRVHLNPEQSSYDLNGSAAGMKWLQSGKMLLTFAASEPGEGSGDQDIYITTSADCATWGPNNILIDHDDITYRITETSHVQYDDGMILTLWRDDTNHTIYKATTTNEYVTFSTAVAFTGWGWPNNALDENERLYCTYRSELMTLDTPVWRFSDDRGITFSEEFKLTSKGNANASPYQASGMTYTDIKTDSDGNLWIAYGLEETDSDIYAKLWRRSPTTSTTTIKNIDAVVRWYSSYGLSNTYNRGSAFTSWDDLSATNDDAVAINNPTYQENVSNQSFVTFDGTDDHMTITETAYSAWTIFFSVGSGAAGALLSSNSNGDILSMDTTFANATLSVSGGTYEWIFSALSAYDIVAINSDGKIWINGVQGTSSSVPSGSLVVNRLGGTPVGNFFAGAVGDVLIADEVLSDANMDLIGGFLAGRWGKTWTEIE